ncbi:MAG TPA: class I SAM-dependent methyltransferase [Longimicrobiaceae bacterium]|nr:class I SAM-dependent methyltransferase [Longimicrobiaceae bacterium]
MPVPVAQARAADHPAAASADEPRYRAMLEEDRERWWRSENWDKWAGHYLSEYPRGRFILRTLRRYAPGLEPRGARVLDVGCGDAGVLIAFAEAGAVCSGVEPDARSLERGRVRAEEHGVTLDLRQGFAETLPFADGAFDLVVLDNVLEHVNDRPRTLAEIHRVLRPGGLLYLVTPKPFAAYSLWSDPHYDLAGLVLMPRRLQVWYFERVRGGGKGNYGVGVIPTRRGVLRLLRRQGFRSLVPPRELWIHYLREKLAAPAGLSSGLKRRVGRWVAERPWVTENAALRWAWDVGIGSNFFIARREG